jgi:hypothetical protein
MWSVLLASCLALACGRPPDPAAEPPTVVAVEPAEEEEPVGVLVELVPAVEGLRFPDERIEVRLLPGDLAATWTRAAAARFPGLKTSASYRISLRGEQGQYLVAPKVTLNATKPNRVPVIPLDPVAELPRPGVERNDSDARDTRALYVDTTPEDGSYELSWRESYLVVRRWKLPGPAADLAEAAANEWEQYGHHRASGDPDFDQALVIASEDADLEMVAEVVRALRTHTRNDPRNHEREVPVFEVRVALPSTVARPGPFPPPPELAPGTVRRFERAKVRMGATWVSGRLRPERIHAVVQQRKERFRLCYLHGLTSNPWLEGRVATRFVIGANGRTANISNSGSDLPDSEVVRCIIRSFYGLEFPKPEGGIVTVVFPMMFSPQ